MTTPYPDKPGFVKLSNEPLLIAAGDGFTGSGFEGCVTSAETTFCDLYSKYQHLVKDKTQVEYGKTA